MVRFTKMGKLDGETNLQLPPITERTVEVRAGGCFAMQLASRCCLCCCGQSPPCLPRLPPLLPPRLGGPLCMFPQLQAPLLLAFSYAVCLLVVLLWRPQCEMNEEDAEMYGALQVGGHTMPVDITSCVYSAFV